MDHPDYIMTWVEAGRERVKAIMQKPGETPDDIWERMRDKVLCGSEVTLIDKAGQEYYYVKKNRLYSKEPHVHLSPAGYEAVHNLSMERACKEFYKKTGLHRHEGIMKDISDGMSDEYLIGKYAPMGLELPMIRIYRKVVAGDISKGRESGLTYEESVQSLRDAGVEVLDVQRASPGNHKIAINRR